MKNDSPCPFSHSLDYLLSEKIMKIGFNTHITVNSTKLTEVFHYSRKFTNKIPYKSCIIKLSIPFTGISGSDKRARILLCLDDEVIADGSMYSSNSMMFNPLFLQGEIPDLKPGTHSITLKCCVNGGILYIPYYDNVSIECTLQPPIQATLIVIGQN